MRDHGLQHVGWALVGGAVGAAVAFLTAPASGAETRAASRGGSKTNGTSCFGRASGPRGTRPTISRSS